MENDIQRHLVDVERNDYVCKDTDGNTSQYILYEGHKYVSGFIQEHDIEGKFKAIAKMKCRDDDVIIMTYPKSGSHWLTNIVTMLAHGNTDYIDAPPVIDYAPIELFDILPSPRVMFTHLQFAMLPEEVKSNKAKIITINRNPKDSLVSLYTFSQKLDAQKTMYCGTWEGCLKFYLAKEFAFDTWFDHIKMWKSVMKNYPNKEILFLSFEDMKKNLYENIKRIDTFIGAECSEELCRDIAATCSFKHMKENAYKGKEVHPNVLRVCKDGFLPIYRKGEIGDWKNWFTVAQSEAFDAVYESEMKGYDLTGIYTPLYESR